MATVLPHYRKKEGLLDALATLDKDYLTRQTGLSGTLSDLGQGYLTGLTGQPGQPGDISTQLSLAESLGQARMMPREKTMGILMELIKAMEANRYRNPTTTTTAQGPGTSLAGLASTGLDIANIWKILNPPKTPTLPVTRQA